MDQPPTHGTDESIAARVGLAVGEFVVRCVLWFYGSSLGLGAILIAIKVGTGLTVPQDVFLWAATALALVATIFHNRIKTTRIWRTAASFYRSAYRTVLLPIGLIIIGFFELIGELFKAIGALIGALLILAVFLFVIVGVFGVLLFGVKQVF